MLYILVKYLSNFDSFKIMIGFVKNANVTEDKNHAIIYKLICNLLYAMIYKMATICQSYCRLECSFPM